jgi:hypothetical protein
MGRLVWWLRIVGVLYVVNAAMMAIVRAPIRSSAPGGTLDAASAGEPLAEFVVDTWLGFGLEVAIIGVLLLVASVVPALAVGVAWTAIGIEITRGMIWDLYMLSQGYDAAVFVPWLFIHAAIIGTGVYVLRGQQSRGGTTAAPAAV